ncbi:hypothetical protein CKM354_000022800 [Cercospora kikuchii]|uniref:Uncharacterized protein n=1 Tax=Cercospora kikuchii TaxID=84275 RepID=A0A9P3C5W3_9PEZI|nr:uncharacterized protein CKM354_000022800 [Cercospora kikuchii]GIZ36761.1 hypothetical protein CKM354_000022800 [Cercospora kikuchii]
MSGVARTNMAERGSQSSTGAASTSLTDTAAAKESRKLLLVARNEKSNAGPRDNGSVTKHAGTWMSATHPEAATAEAFNEDIDSYFPHQARQPSIKNRPRDNQITLQAADQKQKRASDSKRDRIKEWLRHSGPRMLHVTATTAMGTEGSEDSAALRSDETNDWERSDDHESDANGCESTCRVDADGSEFGRTE